jgi:hypothetical protein
MRPTWEKSNQIETLVKILKEDNTEIVLVRKMRRMVDGRYSSSHSWPGLQMVVSGQYVVPAVLIRPR